MLSTSNSSVTLYMYVSYSFENHTGNVKKSHHMTRIDPVNNKHCKISIIIMEVREKQNVDSLI